MLPNLLSALNKRKFVLASGSPRRRELLEKIGLKVVLCPSKFEENLQVRDFDSFTKFVEATAQGKVEEVHKRICPSEGDIVIGADTVVVLDGVVYGKPKDDEDAFRTLKTYGLSGVPHTVYTGVAMKMGLKIITFTESTKVFIGNLTDEEINAYISTGEPRDKAGSYGIQGIGGCLVEKIEGDFFTVMGLPLYRLNKELTKLISSC